MPVHDWMRVDAGIFHAFHLSWLGRLQNALNDGILPKAYYALAEQHSGRIIPDVLTLYGGDSAAHAAAGTGSPPEATGGTAVADAPPKVRRTHSVALSQKGKRRSLAIRHVSGHRLVALLEVASPANKDRSASVKTFVEKVTSALEYGVHVLLVDLFPPRRHDPRGLHGAILQHLDRAERPYELPAGEPLTLASYMAGSVVEMYLEHVAVGTALPDMPLFFMRERYVNVPLQPTYNEAYHGMPALYRDLLDAPA